MTMPTTESIASQVFNGHIRRMAETLHQPVPDAISEAPFIKLFLGYVDLMVETSSTNFTLNQGLHLALLAKDMGVVTPAGYAELLSELHSRNLSIRPPHDFI